MATTAAQEYRQYIGGDWVAANDGGTYDDTDPFTGDVFATVAAGGEDDARRAVDAAATAFPAWSLTPPAERQRIFLKAADLLEARQMEIVESLARETGCSFGFGMFQTIFVPNLFRQAAALAYAPLGQVIPSDTGAFAMGIRKPVGVVGAFAPWNAALILSARSIAAPLALGNAVVLKPSEWSPFSGGLLWGEIFAEAGLPAGVLNIVTHAPGAAGPIGDVLIEHPAVRRLNFTGSSAVGRIIAEAAGRQLKRVVLELGGHNPLIVLDDADLEYAVNASAFGSYLHQGQICMSTRRIYVERPIADEFIERLAEKTRSLKVGDPKEHDTVIGPLISEQALATVKGRVEQAVAAGATVLAGGEAVGPCFQATLLTNVPEDSEFALHETFGPVAAVEIVDNAEQAVEKANRTSYGLSAGIITTDSDRGFSLAQRIDSGIVHVNDQTVADEPQMPFGGVKSSGFGRFGGQAVVDEFTELRWVTIRSESHPFPF
ncbi:MAG TPA: aldehyde dehydrogenase family protein [Gaiellaceae bacterium]|jgi:acyl-CoA reductase-like NAD-dependent aldehyde dehydrogenase|nr:aldehyde dehydrogenase family protein [Gaiellaceae bacterium]